MVFICILNKWRGGWVAKENQKHKFKNGYQLPIPAHGFEMFSYASPWYCYTVGNLHSSSNSGCVSSLDRNWDSTGGIENETQWSREGACFNYYICYLPPRPLESSVIHGRHVTQTETVGLFLESERPKFKFQRINSPYEELFLRTHIFLRTREGGGLEWNGMRRSVEKSVGRKNTERDANDDNKLLQGHELEKFGHDLNFKRSLCTTGHVLNPTTNRVSQTDWGGWRWRWWSGEERVKWSQEAHLKFRVRKKVVVGARKNLRLNKSWQDDFGSAIARSFLGWWCCWWCLCCCCWWLMMMDTMLWIFRGAMHVRCTSAMLLFVFGDSLWHDRGRQESYCD